MQSPPNCQGSKMILLCCISSGFSTRTRQAQSVVWQDSGSPCVNLALPKRQKDGLTSHQCFPKTKAKLVLMSEHCGVIKHSHTDSYFLSDIFLQETFRTKSMRAGDTPTQFQPTSLKLCIGFCPILSLPSEKNCTLQRLQQTSIQHIIQLVHKL